MLLGTASAPRIARAADPVTLVLFPRTLSNDDDVRALVDVRKKLRSGGTYAVITYDPNSAAIKRAASDAQHPEWLSDPMGNDAERLALTRALGASFAIIIAKTDGRGKMDVRVDEAAAAARTWNGYDEKPDAAAQFIQQQAEFALASRAPAAPAPSAPRPLPVKAAVPPASLPVKAASPVAVAPTPSPAPSAPAVAPTLPPATPDAALPRTVPVPVAAPSPVPVAPVAPASRTVPRPVAAPAPAPASPALPATPVPVVPASPATPVPSALPVPAAVPVPVAVPTHSVPVPTLPVPPAVPMPAAPAPGAVPAPGVFAPNTGPAAPAPAPLIVPAAPALAAPAKAAVPTIAPAVPPPAPRASVPVAAAAVAPRPLSIPPASVPMAAALLPVPARPAAVMPPAPAPLTAAKRPVTMPAPRAASVPAIHPAPAQPALPVAVAALPPSESKQGETLIVPSPLPIPAPSQVVVAPAPDAAPLSAPPADQDLASVHSLLTQGDDALSAGNFVAAIAAYRDAVNGAPLAMMPRMRLAQAYLQSDRRDKALSEAQRALQIAPNNAAVQQFLMQLDAETGSSDGAVARFQAAAAQSPQDPAAHLELADALWNNGALSQAEDEYRTAQSLAGPGTAAARQAAAHLARLYAAQSRYADSLGALKQAGAGGYALALGIVQSRADTLRSMLDSGVGLMDAGKTTHEAFYKTASDAAAQAQALADFVVQVSPPAAFSVSHLHRVLATHLMAQQAAVLVSYVETSNASFSDQAARLEKEAVTEMLTAHAAEQKLGLWDAPHAEARN